MIWAATLFALAASAAEPRRWKLKADFPGDLTSILGIAFEDDGSGIITGYRAYIPCTTLPCHPVNGSWLPRILRSEDGGATFNEVPGINFGLDFVVLAAGVRVSLLGPLSHPFGLLWAGRAWACYAWAQGAAFSCLRLTLADMALT